MRIGNRVRHGLLPQHMFVLAHCGNGDRRMPVVGRRDIDRIDARFLVQQLAVVIVRIATFICARRRALARPVKSLDRALYRIPPAHTEAGAKLARKLRFARRREVLAPILVARAHQLAPGLEQIVRAVLGIILAALIAVANCCYLYIGPRQQFLRNGLTLTAQPDRRQVDFVARRHKRRSEDMARNNHESGRAGKCPAGNLTGIIVFQGTPLRGDRFCSKYIAVEGGCAAHEAMRYALTSLRLELDFTPGMASCYGFLVSSRFIAPNIAPSTAFSTTKAVARLPRRAMPITVTVIGSISLSSDASRMPPDSRTSE